MIYLSYTTYPILPILYSPSFYQLSLSTHFRPHRYPTPPPSPLSHQLSDNNGVLLVVTGEFALPIHSNNNNGAGTEEDALTEPLLTEPRRYG